MGLSRFVHTDTQAMVKNITILENLATTVCSDV